MALGAGRHAPEVMRAPSEALAVLWGAARALVGIAVGGTVVLLLLGLVVWSVGWRAPPVLLMFLLTLLGGAVGAALMRRTVQRETTLREADRLVGAHNPSSTHIAASVLVLVGVALALLYGAQAACEGLAILSWKRELDAPLKRLKRALSEVKSADARHVVLTGRLTKRDEKGNVEDPFWLDKWHTATANRKVFSYLDARLSALEALADLLGGESTGQGGQRVAGLAGVLADCNWHPRFAGRLLENAELQECLAELTGSPLDDDHLQGALFSAESYREALVLGEPSKEDAQARGSRGKDGAKEFRERFESVMSRLWGRGSGLRTGFSGLKVPQDAIQPPREQVSRLERMAAELYAASSGELAGRADQDPGESKGYVVLDPWERLGAQWKAAIEKFTEGGDDKLLKEVIGGLGRGKIDCTAFPSMPSPKWFRENSTFPVDRRMDNPGSYQDDWKADAGALLAALFVEQTRAPEGWQDALGPSRCTWGGWGVSNGAATAPYPKRLDSVWQAVGDACCTKAWRAIINKPGGQVAWSTWTAQQLVDALKGELGAQAERLLEVALPWQLDATAQDSGPWPAVRGGPTKAIDLLTSIIEHRYKHSPALHPDTSRWFAALAYARLTVAHIGPKWAADAAERLRGGVPYYNRQGLQAPNELRENLRKAGELQPGPSTHHDANDLVQAPGPSGRRPDYELVHVELCKAWLRVWGDYSPVDGDVNNPVPAEKEAARVMSQLLWDAVHWRLSGTGPAPPFEIGANVQRRQGETVVTHKTSPNGQSTYESQWDKTREGPKSGAGAGGTVK